VTLFRRPVLRTLLIEAAVIAIGIATAVTIIYFKTRPKPVHVERQLAGHEQNVSRNPRVQYAPALAVDPSNPRVLLGGSSDSLNDTRVYTSADAGESWTSDSGPPLLRGNCKTDRPAVAITAGGRQLFAFAASQFCDLPEPKVHVAVRDGVNGRWRVQALLPVAGYAKDEDFAFATSGRRVWLAWSRRPRQFSSGLVGYLATSTDEGTTWSAPRRLPVAQPFALSLAASPGGDLYVAAADGDNNRLVVLRSRDGGRTFGRALRLAAFASPYDEGCEGAFLPPQSQFCIAPSVHVVVDSADRVDVGWADVEANQTDGLRFARLSPALRVQTRPSRLGPPDAAVSDQFDPSLAVDRSDGTLWTCYMDTFGDPYRHLAWPTCTFSRNGGRTWATPVRVAFAASDETQTGANLRGYGSTAVVAANGLAHPMWTDTRNMTERSEEIYASRLPERALRFKPPAAAAPGAARRAGSRA
jgi:hypothetical protein